MKPTLTHFKRTKIGVKLQSKMLISRGQEKQLPREEAVYSAILATFLMYKPP